MRSSGSDVTEALPWLRGPADPTLESDEVHVWRVPLRARDSEIPELWRTLADDERERAERFHFSRDRVKFIIARGTLRALLGRYVDIDPARLQFCYGPYGKPALRDAPGGLRFNLAHSHELALCAIAQGCELGIDLEYERERIAIEQIATKFFSAREAAALCGLPDEKKRAAFYNCWTRKEAFIKLLGSGLSLPLDGFDVSLVPGEPAALLSVAGDVRRAARWTLRELKPATGYFAALALEGHDRQIRLWYWPDIY